MSHPEKALTDKAVKHPLSMNWPPSRGPEPEHITRQPRRTFPDPKIVGDKAIVRSPGYEKEADEEARLVWHPVWAQVTDLLKAGADLSDRLVVGAAFRTDSGENQLRTLKYLGKRGAEPCTLRATLSYPLNREVEIEIQPYTIEFHWRPEDDPKRLRKDMTLGWVLYALAKAYEMIYAEHEKHGVWGHSIRDLCFEQIAIEGDRVHVGVGS